MRKTVCLLLISLCLLSGIFTIFNQPVSAAPISAPAQQVVDELYQKGFDVTFVYFGSERELTFTAEDCAVVAMLTHEQMKNFQFTQSQQEQFREGNISLARAYPNAEAFIVALMEDLDNNGFPDGAGDGVRAQGIYQISGGNYGGKTQTNFMDDYWIHLADYVANVTSPTPTPTANPTEQPNPPSSQSTIELFCQSSTSYDNFEVDITGRLTTAENASIPAAQVLLSYSVNAGNTWIDLTTAVTDSNGEFSEVWKPQATGYYLLKADYAGDTEHANATKFVNFAVAPYQQGQNVFSLTSNSTVTALFFNSTSQTISFSVNGTSGTTGYVSIYLPKSLVADASALKVYLDNEPLTFTASSQGEATLVTFTYHHSTHQVAIQVNSASAASGIDAIQALIIGAVTAAVVVIVVVCLVVLRKRNNPRTVSATV